MDGQKGSYRQEMDGQEVTEQEMKPTELDRHEGKKKKIGSY